MAPFDAVEGIGRIAEVAIVGDAIGAVLRPKIQVCTATQFVRLTPPRKPGIPVASIGTDELEPLVLFVVVVTRKGPHVPDQQAAPGQMSIEGVALHLAVFHQQIFLLLLGQVRIGAETHPQHRPTRIDIVQTQPPGRAVQTL